MSPDGTVDIRAYVTELQEKGYADVLRKGLVNGVRQKKLVVARDRIELSTLRFSVVCSTN